MKEQYVRDYSGAVLNTDINGLAAYKKQKQKFNELNTLKQKIGEIDILKHEIGEIKNVLTEILGHLKNGHHKT